MLAMVHKMLGLLSPNSWKRYESRYHVLSKLVKIFGFRMYNSHLTWFHDSEFLQIWSSSRFYDGHPENIEDRKFVLFQLAKAVSCVDGDTAECGVYKGASSYLILKANKNSSKIHHIFDSFKGLSAPSLADKVSVNRAFKWRKHDLRVSESEVKNNLREFENVKLYKGWIPERFSEAINRKFSFIHIDVDLYQPTYDSLTFFYPRMSPGGIIVCDDYGFETCPGAKRACDEFLKDKEEKVVHLPTGQGVIIKRLIP